MGQTVYADMNRTKYLLKNTALFALNNIGTKLIVFFLVPLYTKALATNEFGVADLVTTLSLIVVPLITLNIQDAVMRFSLDENADHDKIMSVGVTAILITVLFGIIIIPIAGLWSLLRPFAIYFYLYCVTQGIYYLCVSFLRGRELLVPYSITNILVTLTGALFNILFLVYLKMGVEGYFLSFIASYVIGIVLSAFYSRMLGIVRHFRLDRALIRQMCAYSLVLVPNSLMWWIMNASDRLMVISMISASANGIYAISYKIPSAISIMSTVINQAWSYSAIHEENSDDKNAFHEKMYNLLFELQLLIVAFLLLMNKPIIKVYVSESYYEAWRYVPPLLIGYFFMSLGSFISSQYTVNKDSKGFLFSGMLGAVVNVILNFILIPHMGPLGAAIATAAAYISVFSYRVVDTKKYFQIAWISTEKAMSVLLMILMAFLNYPDWPYAWLLMLALFLAALFLARHSIGFILSTGKTILTRKAKR